MGLAQKPLVAVLDTSDDFIKMLIELLELEGYTTVFDYITEYRTGKKDIRAFLNQHNPQVIVYDIAVPYMENWKFFNHAREIIGNDCQFVIVTTNKTALDALVGETNVLEIIGKPFDLDVFLEAVRTSVEQCR